MEWNTGPIYSAIVIALIILIYSREYGGIRTIQNQMFRITLVTTIISMVTLLVSVVLNMGISKYPVFLVEFFNVISRISMTIIAPLFFYYTISIIWTNKEVFFKWIRFTAWVYITFALMIMSSPFTGIISAISDDQEITGPLFYLIFAVPAFYIMLILIFLLFNYHRLSRSLGFVILSFPVLCLIFITIEYFYPQLLISSTAATASLVIAYLYIQNKKILEDDLTGSMNRRAFAKVVSMRLEEGSRFKIIVVSIDEFKSINNQYGEQIGDRFLQAVALYLMNLLPSAHVFRLSGDEFALLTTDTEQPHLIHTISNRLSQKWVVDRKTLPIRATIAELHIPEVADTLEDTVHVLEYCIREEKSLRKGNTITINSDALDRMHRKNKVYEYLKRMIQECELEVVYQPIYHVETDSYPVFEALARLTSPELGPMSPLEFIAIAEEKGLINRLGEVLLEQVCRTIKKLESNGVAFQHININISPIQMMNDNIVSEVEQVLRREQIDPSRIHLEITESVLIDFFDKINKVMSDFNSRGIQFSLDDYGTGYSNLSNIIRLPFTGIKVDKSLLYQASDSPSTFVIIQALSRSFQQIHKNIVIEGVETEEHIKLARAIGCDYLQGYYFAKPMTTENLIVFLKNESFA